eukprot:3941963-Rhodomonas_salina.3
MVCTELRYCARAGARRYYQMGSRQVRWWSKTVSRYHSTPRFPIALCRCVVPVYSPIPYRRTQYSFNPRFPIVIGLCVWYYSSCTVLRDVLH